MAVAQVVDADALHAGPLAASLHLVGEEALGGVGEPVIGLDEGMGDEVVLHLVGQELRHDDGAHGLLGLGRVEHVLAVQAHVGLGDGHAVALEVEVRGMRAKASPLRIPSQYRKTVATCSFDIANDGKNLGPENWEATWGNNHASATIFGEEQNDFRYNLGFDGEIEELQLDTYNGKTIPDTQNEAPRLDEDGYPTAQDYQAYKQEMAAVANYLGLGEFEMEYEITAKGYPYAVISREINETTGQVTELHIIQNEQHSGLSNREYVLQKHHFAADGTESASAEIVDFYLVDCATLEVTDEHTTQWH